tara:strand:- start:117 stop:542 length:426 start_codon:yes stop_codon:yes gene_type:complete
MIRQENIYLSSDKQEFSKLYHPKGKRYLRGLDSYLYHKDLKPISEAQRLVAKGINPLGVRPVNVILPLPANATPAQTQEWIIRTQAYSNPRIDTGADFKPYVSGWETGGVNREMVQRNAVGMIYNEAKIASSRTQKVLPIY